MTLHNPSPSPPKLVLHPERNILGKLFLNVKNLLILPGFYFVFLFILFVLSQCFLDQITLF